MNTDNTDFYAKAQREIHLLTAKYVKCTKL